MKKKSVSEELVTKDSLREELSKIEHKFTGLENKFDRKFDEMNENFRKYRDEVLNRFDFFVKDFEINREDRDLAVHQTRELEERVDNHEKRIKKLETHI